MKFQISNFNCQISKSFFLLGLILLSVGCQPKPEKQKAEEIIPVRVIKVRSQELAETIDYVGNIRAKDEALIYPKVSGKIIEKVKEDGQPVNKGEVILYIDRDEVGLKFERAPVESTLTGFVGRVYVDIGENVDPQTAVALVVDMHEAKTDLDIPEKYLAKISLGQLAKISVDAYPGEEFSGKVTKISPIVDMNTRSSPIEISVANPEHRLKSGMFAKVSLVVREKKEVPVVMKEAIIGKEPDQYIFIIEDNKAILKKISLGIHQGPYFEVRQGLKEGDLVVVMGQQRLTEGSSVKIEENK
jgi:multidrug efflux pump subunit AcrA (membrane-fusion protein)